MERCIISFFIGTALILGGCATLKEPPPLEDVFAIDPAAKGVLAQAANQFSKKHPHGESGFLVLSANKEAFMWRLALIDEATQSIDAQYFIFQNDEAGILVFDRLLKAADRGVRVRLLVDDIAFAAKDRNKKGEVNTSPFSLRDTTDVFLSSCPTVPE